MQGSGRTLSADTIHLRIILNISAIHVFHAASKLSPKKFGLSGTSRVVLLAFLGGVSFLLSQGIDIRPNLAVILALATADAIFLGGSCLAQILCFWPPYRRRVLVHEAGHLLTGDYNCNKSSYYI